MIETLIVADDLTGANATGSLLAKHGLRVGTLMGQTELTDLTQFDVLAVTTDSRGSTPEIARQRVSQVMRDFQATSVGFCNKRIDSTLRGNVGAEIDAMLDQLVPETVAVVVAAFPSSGRISSGGYLLVDGIPLEQTGVAADPTSPVTQSNIVEIIASQTKRTVGYISLQTVMSGDQLVIEALLAQHTSGNRIIVVDACTNEDIATIAKAVITSELPYIAVDPGPFTEALAIASAGDLPRKHLSKLLFVVGSATELTRQQLAHFQGAYQPLTVKLEVLNFLKSSTREAEIKRGVQMVISQFEENETFLLATNLAATDIVDLEAAAIQVNLTLTEASELITESLAEITYQLLTLTADQIRGIYLSGGDVTVAFCQKVKASGVEVLDEILPLAVYGQLIGGTRQGQVIVTKGGLVGDGEALTKCAQYLERVTQHQEVE